LHQEGVSQGCAVQWCHLILPKMDQFTHGNENVGILTQNLLQNLL